MLKTVQCDTSSDVSFLVSFLLHKDDKHRFYVLHMLHDWSAIRAIPRRRKHLQAAGSCLADGSEEFVRHGQTSRVEGRVEGGMEPRVPGRVSAP